MQHERDVFAASLDPERARQFSGIRVEGVRDASLSVVVTYDPLRGSPDGWKAATRLIAAKMGISGRWMRAPSAVSRRTTGSPPGSTDSM